MSVWGKFVIRLRAAALAAALLAVLPAVLSAQTKEDVEWAKMQSAVICNRIWENEQFLVNAMEDIRKEYAAENLRHEKVRADLTAQSPVPTAEVRKEDALHAENMRDITSRRNQLRDEYEEENRQINAATKKFQAEMQYRASVAPASENRRNFYDSTVRRSYCAFFGGGE